MTEMTEQGAKVAPLIDHTLLKAEATRTQVTTLCKEARTYGFAAVCVHPCLIRFAADQLAGSSVKPGTVIGFPMGDSTSTTKAFEAEDALRNGAQELDMVLALSAMKDRDHSYVLNDIKAVVKAAAGRTVKVIFETCLLTDEEKVTACRLAVEAGAHFVKTSTGLAGGGATVEDIRLMRQTVGNRCGVKASGGIRTLDDALKMIAAGANRIGTSAGVAIVTSKS
jgi:deoxyribose-phosphate aldolase